MLCEAQRPLVQGTSLLLRHGPPVQGTGPLVHCMGLFCRAWWPLVQGMGPLVKGTVASSSGHGGLFCRARWPLVQGMGPLVLLVGAP